MEIQFAENDFFYLKNHQVKSSEELSIFKQLGGIYDHRKECFKFPLESFEQLRIFFGQHEKNFNSSSDEEVSGMERTSSCESLDSRSSDSDVPERHHFHREKSFDKNDD